MLYRLFKALLCVVPCLLGGKMVADLYLQKNQSKEGAGSQWVVRTGAGLLGGLVLANRRRIPHGRWRWLALGSITGAAALPVAMDYVGEKERLPFNEPREQGIGAIIGLGLTAFWLKIGTRFRLAAIGAVITGIAYGRWLQRNAKRAEFGRN